VNIQVYSSKPLERKITLSGDPYKLRNAKQELQLMGVVFWRDEDHNAGIILQPNVKNETLYYSQGIFAENDDNWSIDEWEEEALSQDESDNDELGKSLGSQKNPKKRVDNYAWIVFNEPRYVLDVVSDGVKLVG